MSPKFSFVSFKVEGVRAGTMPPTTAGAGAAAGAGEGECAGAGAGAVQTSGDREVDTMDIPTEANTTFSEGSDVFDELLETEVDSIDPCYFGEQDELDQFHPEPSWPG